jgi:sialidase-1
VRTRPSPRLSVALGGVVVAAVLLAVVAPVPTSAQAEAGTVVGRPQIALSAQDAELQVGERNTLAVLVANDGDVDRGGPAEFVDRVTTARNVRLSVAEDRLDEDLARAIDVRTGTVLVGSVGREVSGPHEIELDVSESLRPGTYEIPVEVTYDYTSFVEYGPATNPVFGDATRREVVTLEVTVENRPRFAIEATDGTVPAGETGTLSLSVTNVGGRTATSARPTRRCFSASARTPRSRRRCSSRNSGAATSEPSRCPSAPRGTPVRAPTH